MYVESGMDSRPSNCAQAVVSTRPQHRPCPRTLPSFTDLQSLERFPLLRQPSKCWRQTGRPADRQEKGQGLRAQWTGLRAQWTEVPFLNADPPHPTFASLNCHHLNSVTISVFRPQPSDQDAFQIIWASVSPSLAHNSPHLHPLFAKVSISSQPRSGRGGLFPEHAYVSLSHCRGAPPPISGSKMDGSRGLTHRGSTGSVAESSLPTCPALSQSPEPSSSPLLHLTPPYPELLTDPAGIHLQPCHGRWQHPPAH